MSGHPDGIICTSSAHEVPIPGYLLLPLMSQQCHLLAPQAPPIGQSLVSLQLPPSEGRGERARARSARWDGTGGKVRRAWQGSVMGVSERRCQGEARAEVECGRKEGGGKGGNKQTRRIIELCLCHRGLILWKNLVLQM